MNCLGVLVAVVMALSLTACGATGDGGVPAPTPTPPVRALHVGAPQVTEKDPTDRARAWQVASAVTRAGGVVVIGIDDIAVHTGSGRAVPGTLALAREAIVWGRSVVYLTTNGDVARVRMYLARDGYPHGDVWAPRTAPWCGRFVDDLQFRAACITYLARHREVILWLTRGRQYATPADRTYAFG